MCKELCRHGTEAVILAKFTWLKVITTRIRDITTFSSGLDPKLESLVVPIKPEADIILSVDSRSYTPAEVIEKVAVVLQLMRQMLVLQDQNEIQLA